MAGQRFTNADRGRTRLRASQIAATNLRSTGGRLESATRDLAGDGVAAADA